MTPFYKLYIGESQTGRCLLDFSVSPGARIVASPGSGKSTLLEAIASAARSAHQRTRIIIISTTGRFDYQINNFEFYSSIRHKEEMFRVLEELNTEMNAYLTRMEELNTKDVTQLPEWRPSLVLIDELESIEACLTDKKDLEKFARLVTLRINGGRKVFAWTCTSTQGMTLDTTVTKTRSFSITITGRPQTKAICHALAIDEKYFQDYDLKHGRMLLIADGDCQVIKVRRVS